MERGMKRRKMQVDREKQMLCEKLVVRRRMVIARETKANNGAANLICRSLLRLLMLLLLSTFVFRLWLSPALINGLRSARDNAGQRPKVLVPAGGNQAKWWACLSIQWDLKQEKREKSQDSLSNCWFPPATNLPGLQAKQFLISSNLILDARKSYTGQQVFLNWNRIELRLTYSHLTIKVKYLGLHYYTGNFTC